MTIPNHYLLSGEFHYFRLPKAHWKDRLLQVKDLGMGAVSIYVPWNWHEPQPGALDLTGKTLPEKDLLGALDAIASAGLGCIFRPGPFITNEWRGGGLPDWLWEQNPQILSLDVNGLPSGRNRPYPALTYAHPIYRITCQKWYFDLLGAVKGYFASRGGPIFHFQLDDEPSYWHLLAYPLMADYNPFLISHEEHPSLYAYWLLQRYGSLDALNASHNIYYGSPEEIEPPRLEIAQRDGLVRYQDWLDFKLWTIDEYTRFLYKLARDCGVTETISQLYPYLLPMQATKHAAYLRKNNLPIELTNEVYVNLFSANTFPEQKVGHIVFGHEYYHMWRGSQNGPAITMELQGSNASFITPETMEILYAITLARGIKGFNIFMMVGGENPPGYENLTGQEYDISAPISLSGEERLHAATLRKIARIIHAGEQELLSAEPLRDVWWGCYTPYESALLTGGSSALADVGFAMKYLVGSGEHGTSDATNLQALLTLSNVSCGCLDLEKATAEELAGIPQLWVFSLDFMDCPVQTKLTEYVKTGGHLVMLPSVPYLDEQMEPCEVLMDMIFKGLPRPEFAGVFPEYPMLFTQIRGKDGESLVSPGKPTTYDLNAEANPLAFQASDGRPCAFERTIGKGKVTVLGFPLVYIHTASPRQKEFIAKIVEGTTRRRYSWASNHQLVAMELANLQSGFVCLVNPVDLPAATLVNYTLPHSHSPAKFPLVLERLRMSRRGARLLPVGLPLSDGIILRHTTWELLARNTPGGVIELEFAAEPGASGEVAFEGKPVKIVVAGGRVIKTSHLDGQITAVVISARQEKVILKVRSPS